MQGSNTLLLGCQPASWVSEVLYNAPAPMAQKCMGALISAASYPHGKNVQHIYFSWEFIISDGLAVLIGVKGDRGDIGERYLIKSVCLYGIYKHDNFTLLPKDKRVGFFLLELQ